ncbi:Retrovirus-related Pol polyprotein from transposon RE2 [Vitis vinifera]|uniref:Retrovirus-related Pol polyprotein from transposon RE2 n=1 Tax=Vitis vinifera TaxID=29760 RepID=A0A438DG88_VITVI|nr:Retrovirus-related Pol polyprotein from transposon RE2 [Vitis vinifera]
MALFDPNIFRSLDNENYLSWFASVELWFMSQGYEDHLVTQEADISEIDRVASSIVNVRQQDMNLSTYIGQIASLKEEFLTVMPLTTDILGSFSVPSLDDVFARLLRISSTQTLPSDNTSDSSLHGRPPRTAHVVQSSDPQPPQPPSSSTSQGISLIDSEYDDYLRYQATKSAFVASIAQTGNVSACLTHTSSLGPWILDSGASDHISGNKDLFSSITTTSALPTVTLANGSQIVAKGIGPEYGEDDWHRTHHSLSKFQKMVPRFSSLSSLACKSCQLGKHTHVSFPKRLNNRAKSHFELVHTDDKLSAKATKCIFLGYSRLQKGYRCYSSETHRYFLSADVTFFEDSPFFSTSESLPISEVLPLPIISPPDAVPSRPLQVIIVIIVSLFLFWPRYLLTHFLSLRLLLPRLCLLLPTYPLLFGKSTPEAIFHPDWRQTMVDEMIALHFNVTWDLVVLPSGKSTVGCRWVYTVKVGPDGQVDRLKGHLVAKGYTQVYGSDYGDTFSPVAKIASVRLLLSMAVMRSWPLYQLDIKNAFLHGDLAEEVYMEQPPGFVAQGESGLVCRLRRSLYGLKQSPRAWFSRFSSVVQEFDMFRSTANHSVFYHHNSSGLKTWGKLKYFLEIEIAQSSSGVVLSQRKYALDILEETGMLDCKPVDTPMDPNVKLIPGQGEPLRDPGRYRRLVGKLNYLTITCPDISFPAKVCCTKTEVIPRLLVTQMQIGLTHPQIDVPLPSILRFGKDEQMKLICDNQAALHIASNPVFHERTKHIEVDCHFIREKIASGCMATSFVNSNDQLADIFTKSLRGLRIKYICNKLGAYNIYALA